MNGHLGAAVYEIRVDRQLGPHITALFPEFLCSLEQGSTLLRGLLPDQAALHGVLTRIRDLGLILISVERLDHPPPAHHTK